MILQSLKMALKAIASNKMRTFLTTLGIIIGVVALVVLVSLVTSSTSAITDQVSSIGSDYLTVNIRDDKGSPLRLGDVKGFAENDDILQTAPYAQMSSTAKQGRTSIERATVYGVTAEYFSVQGLTLARGRHILTSDVENNTYVAVLSHDAAEELFGNADAIDGTVSLGGRRFTVIGVASQDDGGFASIMRSSVAIYIPYTSAVRISDSMTNTVTAFYAAAGENGMDAAEDALSGMLLERFDGDEDAFSVTNLSVIADALSSITDMLSLLLGGIAAISLLVGGIGIMNIMLVSVTERTREIGIRKAIGAGRGSIMLQFLIEALVVSLLGCLLGILGSWGILELVNVIAGETMSFSLSPGVVTIAVAFSIFIGVVFGIYPAHKASVKHPIEALRYEG